MVNRAWFLRPLKLLSLDKNIVKWLDLGLVVLGLATAAFGGVQWWQQRSDSLLCTAQALSPDQEAEQPPVGKLVVDISGAVNQPGVYQLWLGDRLEKAIQLAGGFSPDVDMEFLHRQLNLAAAATDGQKIYVPFLQEKTVPVEHNIKSVDTAQSVTSELVSLNTATLSELDSLPGIGPSRAADIVAGRPYSTLGEVVERDIITQTLWQEIESRLTL